MIFLFNSYLSKYCQDILEDRHYAWHLKEYVPSYRAFKDLYLVCLHL